MIEWRQGYQVVYAQPHPTPPGGMVQAFHRLWVLSLLKHLADVDIPTDTGDFCLLDRQVVDVLNSMPERNRYIRGLRSWVGFRQTAVRFERDPRYAGSQMPFGK